MHRSFKHLTARVRPALVAAAAFSFLAALPVATSQATAAMSQVGNEDLPRMVVSVDALEYGEIFDNKIIDKSFTISNEGASTLVIRGVKGSCQCTEPVIGDTVLDPGESTEVTVGVKPFNKTGAFRQRVTITSNDPTNPNKVLEVNAFVRPLVQFSPRLLHFPQLEKGSVMTRTVKIKGRGSDFKVTGVEHVDLDVESIEISEPTQVMLLGEPYNEYEVKVTVKAASVGHIRGKVQFKTNLEEETEQEVPVVVIVQSDLDVSPKQLSLNPLRKGQPWSKSIKVTHRKRESFKIDNIEFVGIQNFPIETDIVEIAPWTYEIKMSGVVPQNAGFVNGRMMIKTDVAGEAETPVAFFGNAR